MKTKPFVLVAVLSLVIFTPTVVRAEATVSPTVSPRIRQEMRETRQETRQELKEVKKETKETLKTTQTQTKLEYKRNRTLAHQKGIYNSFTVRATALVKYQALVQSRYDAKLAKLSATNQNLVSAKTKLDSLAGLTTAYSTSLSAYKSTIDGIPTSTDPSTLLPTLKAQAKKVESDLKLLRQTLVEALRLIVKAK